MLSPWGLLGPSPLNSELDHFPLGPALATPWAHLLLARSMDWALQCGRQVSTSQWKRRGSMCTCRTILDGALLTHTLVSLCVLGPFLLSLYVPTEHPLLCSFCQGSLGHCTQLPCQL